MIGNSKKIKILFHIDTLSGGGAEKVLLTLVNSLDKTKFDVTVSTVFPDTNSYQLDNAIHYKSLYSSDNLFTRLLYRIENELKLVYINRLSDDYDIECAYLECGPTKVVASSSNNKARKLAWVHCDFAVAFNQNFVKKTKKYYQKFDQIVCVSEQCKKSFSRLYGNTYNVVVIHNVINSDEILEKSLEPLPEGVKKRKLTLCSSGRFSPQKNYSRLLNTVKLLKEDGLDFDLWILGDGEERTKIEQIIKDSQLEETVTLFGFQQNPYPFMRESDLLVCSSNYEGFSTFLTEGVILNKPILTTDCSGMHDILDGYAEGSIVENNDEAFLIGLREKIINRSEKYQMTANKFDKASLLKENENFLIDQVKESRYI